jgi:hypothetical protein
MAAWARPRLGIAALVLCAALAGCSKEESAAKPAARAGLGVADTVVGGMKAALLELKREGDGALLLRWELRNVTGEKIEVPPLNQAGMNPWRLARGAAVQDAGGTMYEVLDYSTPKPQAAKHDDFNFAARFAPRQVVQTWARLKAPPADVRRVDVYLPAAQPIKDVPIGSP